MYELALFILDIAQNSLSADANLIKIWLDESSELNRLTVIVADNGRGMDSKTCGMAVDPFRTTKKRKKKIGLGLPLFKQLVEMCDGAFELRSRPRMGTIVYGYFPLHHIDQPPVGKMADTIFALVAGNSNVNFRYTHKRDGQSKVFDTRPVRQALGEDAQSLWQTAEILEWIDGAIHETD